MIPSEGPPPLYFSSTNARISARAWLSGTSLGFESFRLTLNGSQVYGKTFTPQERELHSSWRVHVMFDSTKWGASAASCEVRLYAKEVGQPEQSTSINVEIKNRAAGYILSHFVATGDSLTPTMDALEAMGYVNQAEVSAPDWTAAQCLGDIAGCTIFYVASHGNMDNLQTVKFWDGTSAPSNPPPGTPVYALAHGTDAAVKPVREASVGLYLPIEQLPPFNPTGNPPIAFGWVDVCVTGWSESFRHAFCYPSNNKYRPDQIENQSSAGWDGFTSNEVNAYFATRFWYHAGAGKTVALAAAAAKVDTNTWHKATYGPDYVDTLLIKGDVMTRLKHVYTGTTKLAPTLPGNGDPWFRIITSPQETEGW